MFLNEEAFAVIRASYGKTAAGRLLLGAGVLALLIPAIAGCEAGSDAPTLQFHPASAGQQIVFDGIKITDAFVLGARVRFYRADRVVGQLVRVALQRRQQLRHAAERYRTGYCHEHLPAWRDGAPPGELGPRRPDGPRARRWYLRT